MTATYSVPAQGLQVQPLHQTSQLHNLLLIAPKALQN